MNNNNINPLLHELFCWWTKIFYLFSVALGSSDDILMQNKTKNLINVKK